MNENSMTGWSTARRIGLYIEFAFVVVILISVVNVYIYLIREGQLPGPYYHANDTFMDWVNTAYWANNPGAYFAYFTVYPPISFDFLWIFTPHYCYRFDNFYNRECDWMLPWVLGGFFSINCFLVYKCFKLRDRRTAWLRAIAMSFGLPMLFGVERGQLAIPCFTFFVLANGRLLRSAKWRWLSAGIAINFKPYLLLTIIPQVLKRRWRAAEGCVLAVLGVYLVSYAMSGVGTPIEIINNMLGFNEIPIDIRFDSVYYQSSYKAIVDALGSRIPFAYFIGSTWVNLLQYGLPVLIKMGQFGVAVCFIGTIFRPQAVPLHRLTAMSITFATTAILAGGYSQIFLFFLVFLEPWRGPARIIALVTAYILSISFEYQVVLITHQDSLSYLTKRWVGYDLGVTVGELIRPGMIILIEYALIAASLTDLIRWKRNPQEPGLQTPAGAALEST